MDSGRPSQVAIHAEPAIKWQGAASQRFSNGLKALGIGCTITTERTRVSDVSVLLGTTLWRNIERTGKYLLVDRASFGDPEYVSLVWDGHGRRGNHCVPDGYCDRWGKQKHLVEMFRWDIHGDRVVLCGQTEPYSPHYNRLEDWYDEVEATHFRAHPAGNNPTGLPRAYDWTDCGLAVTLNSSIGVESVLKGIPTVTMDQGAMAWDVSSHADGQIYTPNRRDWLEWLCWTQWSWSEIEQGKPIRHLFEDI